MRFRQQHEERKKRLIEGSKKLTTLDMEIALMNVLNVRQNIIVPNVHWGFDIHECDLLKISKAGYATEIEIKISKSDLKADLKKKHGHKSKKIKNMYYAVPLFLYEDCLEQVPIECGIFTVYEEDGKLKASEERMAKNNDDFIKLSDKEILKVAHLGCMRIQSLKTKIRSFRVD